MVNKNGLAGFSNRKNAKYYVVNYKVILGRGDTGKKTNTVLNKEFRIKCKNKKNAVLQLRKQFNNLQKDYINKNDAGKIVNIVSVTQTDSFFRRL